MNKTFKFEVKEFGEQGTFTGLASVYGNVDLGDDIVEAGAFTKTLSDKNGEFPILWQHDTREPIGLGNLVDSPQGLQIKGELALESPVGLKAYALLKRGILRGLSIGYDTVRKEMKDGKRILKELKLWEVSLVTFPMNELAIVSTVKSEEDCLTRDEIKFIRALAVKHAAEVIAPANQHAAQHEDDAPLLHPSFDRITQLLRGQ